MNYEIKQVKSQSAYEWNYENGAVVLVSYTTPVAVYVPGDGFIETNQKFSRTTSKHINQWKNRHGVTQARTVPQEEIKGWVVLLSTQEMQRTTVVR
jgi:hypothetical protein